MEEVRGTLEAVAAERRIPSLSLCVMVDGLERFHHTVGAARTVPRRAAHPDQAYDLASVTKALAGTTVIASLVEEGRFDLETPVARWFPEVDGRVVVRHLLVHASGWPAWRPFYADVQGAWGAASARDQVLRAIRAIPIEAEPGTRHVYSDLGFMTLMAIAEAETEGSFDALFRDRIQVPAAIADLRWGWPTAAATELCPVRDILIEGTVHDLNCASLGGVSAHAGLFGTARAVAGLADALRSAVAGERTDLPGRTLREMWATVGPGSHRGGWDSPSDGYTSTGQWFPPDSRGHLGYTGTSVWVVPSRRTTVALLTNRVHPVDDKEPIRAARPRIHDAVSRALGWDTGSV